VFSTGSMFLIRNKANGLLAFSGPVALLIDRVYFLEYSAAGRYWRHSGQMLSSFPSIFKSMQQISQCR
jgi:hypothetical protein